MKYAKLKVLADNMTPEEANDSLRSLVNDNRFAAVVKLITTQKELAADFSCGVNFAGSHGALAHAAGVRYGMKELEGTLQQLCDPPKQRGQKAPAK